MAGQRADGQLRQRYGMAWHGAAKGLQQPASFSRPSKRFPTLGEFIHWDGHTGWQEKVGDGWAKHMDGLFVRMVALAQEKMVGRHFGQSCSDLKDDGLNLSCFSSHLYLFLVGGAEASYLRRRCRTT